MHPIGPCKLFRTIGGCLLSGDVTKGILNIEFMEIPSRRLQGTIAYRTVSLWADSPNKSAEFFREKEEPMSDPPVSIKCAYWCGPLPLGGEAGAPGGRCIGT